MEIEQYDEGVLGLWLARPDKRNALDSQTVETLDGALATTSARVVVIGSSDSRWFSAGADLSLADDERAVLSDRLYALYSRVIGLPAAVIAAVSGPAIGGGAQLAVACDLRVGAPSASLRFPGPGHGLAVGAWGLPSLVGRGRALDLCLTGREVAASEALSIGLLDRLEPEARPAALELALALARLDPDAMASVKRIGSERARLAAALGDERVTNRAHWTGSIAGLGWAPRE